MNPFKAFVIALAAFRQELSAKLNPSLASLPPIEQVEAIEPVKDILRAMRWAQEDAKRMEENFSGTLAKVEEVYAKFVKDTGDTAVAAALEAKEVIRKEDHDNLLTMARQEEREAVTQEFAQKAQQAELASTRRKDLVAKVGEVAAAGVTDDMILAEGWEGLEIKIAARLEKLKESNITEETAPVAFGSLVKIPVHAEGEKEFDSRLPAYAELAKNAKPAPKSSPGSRTHVLATGGGGGGEKPRRSF